MKFSKFLLVLMLVVTGASLWSCKEDPVELQPVNFKGLEVATKGDANIEITDGILVASNLGKSAEDAVFFTLPSIDNPDNSIQVNISFLDADLSDELSNRVKRITSYKNIDGRLMAQNWVEKQDQSSVFGFDYNELGISLANIKLLQNGETIGVINNYSGNTFSIPTSNSSSSGSNCRWVHWECYPNGDYLLKLVCDNATTIAFQDNQNFAKIDEILIELTPDEPGINPDNSISTVEVSTQNIETVKFSNISF